MSDKCDLSAYAGQPNVWVLVNYLPFEGRHNLAWVNVLEVTDYGYLVAEVESIYLEGDVINGPFRYIGGSSCKRHLICDEKKRSKEEIRIYEPVKVRTTAEVFSE